MMLSRTVRETLTPCVLNHGDTLAFTLSDGRVWTMTLRETAAWVTAHGTAERLPDGGIAAYAFSGEVEINGAAYRLERAVGTQASFYTPVEVDGVRIWFDAVSAIFADSGGFLGEKDWSAGCICNPYHHARFAVQEVGKSICPEPLARWYDHEPRALDIRDCYTGEDCWMGPFNGTHGHCGLDINMPAGTRLYAPISFDDQYYFHAVAAGFNNNRWRGVRRWPDGSEWWLQSHHLIDLLVPERTPLQRGTPYATAAGVWVGAFEHSHFMFRILDQGGDYLLDPWILFREMA